MLKGFIFKHKEGDYEIVTDITLTDEEQVQMMMILSNHINEGFSVRGTLEECFEDIS